MSRYRRRYRRRQTGKDKLVFIILFGVISPIVSVVIGFFLVKYMIYPRFISSNDIPIVNEQQQQEQISDNSITPELSARNFEIFNIQVGSFAELENAKELVESLKGKNIPGYIVKLDNYKVFSGTFLSRTDAEEYKQYLNQNIEEIYINENFVEGKTITDEELDKEAVKKISELLNQFRESYIGETNIWKDALIAKDESKIKILLADNNTKIKGIVDEIKVEESTINELKKVLDSRAKIQKDLTKDNLISYYSDYNKTLVEYINIMRKSEEE